MLELGNFTIHILYFCIAIGALILGFALSRIYKHALSPFIVKICDKKQKGYATTIANAFSVPTTALLLFFGVYTFVIFIVKSFMLPEMPGFAVFLVKAARLAVILYITWVLFRGGDIFADIVNGVGSKLDLETGKTAARFLGYIFRGIIIAISAVIILSEFNCDVNGLIAGLGLGGLTIALAAKDSASNFFGGLIIIFEKPFEIGDWINSEGLEGTVEDITFRSTKIRTIANTLIIVPNSMLAAQPIVNSSRMNMRRAQHILAVHPSSKSADIQNVLTQIRNLLIENDRLVSDTVLVKLSDFTTDGINISVVYFTKTTNFAEYMDIKDIMNLKILDILHGNNVELTLLRK